MHRSMAREKKRKTKKQRLGTNNKMINEFHKATRFELWLLRYGGFSV